MLISYTKRWRGDRELELIMCTGSKEIDKSSVMENLWQILSWTKHDILLFMSKHSSLFFSPRIFLITNHCRLNGWTGWRGRIFWHLDPFFTSKTFRFQISGKNEVFLINVPITIFFKWFTSSWLSFKMAFLK